MRRKGLLDKIRGFTLIELLVVIAIIAILAAILFPIFANSKAAAKRSADLQSQRQLGMAICQYADDNHGTYPWVSRRGTLHYFPKYPEVSQCTTTISGELIYLLKPYVKNKQIFYCPAVDALAKYAKFSEYAKHLSYADQSKLDPPFMQIGYYYFCNDEWGGPKPITQTGSPRRILISCVGGDVSHNVGGQEEGISGHGLAQGIYTFADGHAKFIRHFNYPYNYPECLAIKDMSKLLMPKWNDQ